MARQIAPDTTDGWAVLHQFFDVDWKGIREHKNAESLAQELSSWIAGYEGYSTEKGQSAAFHILGSKGPLCLLHFRPEFSGLADVELALYRMPISEFLKVKHSYVSVVEMGMYHTTKKIVDTLMAEGLTLGSSEFDAALAARMAHHKENLFERAYTEIPDQPYVCFYPMNKKRGEVNNWYREDLGKRAELMMEHGMTGRKFSGKIQQIISGSIGFDGWEWGVDLFATDPLDFKRIVYEMRFDDATSLYGEFGDFWFGTRIKAGKLTPWFCGA